MNNTRTTSSLPPPFGQNTHTHNHDLSLHQKITIQPTSTTTTSIITNNNNITTLNHINKITQPHKTLTISAKISHNSKLVKTWLHKSLTTFNHQRKKKGNKNHQNPSLKKGMGAGLLGRTMGEFFAFAYKVMCKVFIKTLATYIYIWSHNLNYLGQGDHKSWSSLGYNIYIDT